MHKHDLKKEIKQLVDIGIALTGTRSLDELLNQIVTEARKFTNSDAGSLYLVEGDGLRFVVAQNDTLGLSGPLDTTETFSTISISNESMAGYVANSGLCLNIEDAYNISSDKEFTLNKDFDRKNNYQTKSMLLVPMKTKEGKIVGVLQLINALDDEGNVISFDKSQETLVQALASQAAVSVENVQLTEKLKSAYFQVIVALAAAAEYKDQDTALHLKRMSLYSRLMARDLGLSKAEVDLIYYASPMHDVGKIGIPDSILLKPGPLNKQEWLEMQNHTIYGSDIIGKSNPNGEELLEAANVVALSHHEKFDGTGYPKKLKGDDIPLMGRIVALADVFDALTSKRCYKPAFPFERVLTMIEEGRGSHFHPDCVDAFFHNIDEVERIYRKHSDSNGSTVNK